MATPTYVPSQAKYFGEYPQQGSIDLLESTLPNQAKKTVNKCYTGHKT